SHFTRSWQYIFNQSFAATITSPPATAISSSFFFSCSGHHRDLHSFPTRRSSDLAASLSRSARVGLPQADPSKRPQQPHHRQRQQDRKSTRLNSSHVEISYAVFCLKKKIQLTTIITIRQIPLSCMYHLGATTMVVY